MTFISPDQNRWGRWPSRRAAGRSRCAGLKRAFCTAASAASSSRAKPDDLLDLHLARHAGLVDEHAHAARGRIRRCAATARGYSGWTCSQVLHRRRRQILRRCRRRRRRGRRRRGDHDRRRRRRGDVTGSGGGAGTTNGAGAGLGGAAITGTGGGAFLTMGCGLRRRRRCAARAGGAGGAIRSTNIGAASRTASRTARICISPHAPAACAATIAAITARRCAGDRPSLPRRAGGDQVQRRREGVHAAVNRVRRAVQPRNLTQMRTIPIAVWMPVAVGRTPRYSSAHEDHRPLAAARRRPAAGGLPLPRRRGRELQLGADRGPGARAAQHAAAADPGAADAAGDAAHARACSCS